MFTIHHDTGLLSFGQALAERDDYIRFLSGGSSASPIELLRIAGVDMESPVPIESAMKRFEELVAELETLI